MREARTYISTRVIGCNVVSSGVALAADEGGLWRTRGGGLNWTPIFDDKPLTAVGDVMVARLAIRL